MALKHTLRAMDKGVSAYAFGVAFILVIYMLLTFVFSTINFIVGLPELLSITTGNSLSGEALEHRKEVEIAILHFIAFTIVLIKAYRILISYAKTQHINLKLLVEISIIAPAIEILFNAHAYSLELLILLGVYGIANLLIYVYHYPTFIKIGDEKD